jgi:hypothetical protein
MVLRPAVAARTKTDLVAFFARPLHGGYHISGCPPPWPSHSQYTSLGPPLCRLLYVYNHHSVGGC